MSGLKHRFSDYLRYELNRSPLTVEAYLSDISQFARFLATSHTDQTDTNENNAFSSVEDVILTDASTADIRAWVAELSATGDKPRTLRRKTQSLRTFYRYLMKQKRIRSNPAADIVLAKADKPLPQFVRESEIENILRQPENPENFIEIRDRLIVSLLYTTGMRRAELIALRDADVDLGAMQLKVTGKRSKQRIIPFGHSSATDIRNYIELRDNEESEKSGPAREKGLLFTHLGRPISRTRLTEIVHKKLAGTTVAKKSPHVLRHTFATVMLNHGAEINSVKELLGHASVATTQIYTHLSFAELRKNYFTAHPREQKSYKSEENQQAGGESFENSPDSDAKQSQAN